MTRILWTMLGWVGAALAITGCNSFTSLDGVVGPHHDAGTGILDMGMNDAAADATTIDADSSDMGRGVYTPIDTTLLFQPDGGCGSSGMNSHIDVAGANLPSSERPLGFSIALDANGIGFVRWRSGAESRGANVTMTAMQSNYTAGLDFWADYPNNVIDTRITRNDLAELDLNFFSATLTECSLGVFLRGENGTQMFSSTIENSTQFQQSCPADQEFALGTAGGFNPFNPEQEYGLFYITSFRGNELRSWNPSNPIENNATTIVENDWLPSAAEPFVESTTGALIGFGSEDKEHFLLWNTIPSSRVVDSGVQGVPGKIALLHLVSEHYVLAVVEEEWIALRRFEHRVDENDESEIIWRDDDLRIPINNDVQFMELAAMPGGFAVFYDQGDQWTFQPILMVESEPSERLVMTTAKINYAYGANITYTDMDFTTTAIGCDLVLSMVAGFTIDDMNFRTNFEGGVFRNFYGQTLPATP